MRIQVLLIMTAGLLLGADDAKKEHEKIKGKWTLVSIESHEGKVEPKRATVEFTLDKMTIKLGTKDNGRQFTYKLDPSKTPRVIELVRDNRPEVPAQHGIYQFDGDTLKICTAEMGARPKEFKPDEATQTIIVTLKRQK